MKEFNKVEKVFIKSSNNVPKILLRYTISLSIYYIIVLAYFLLKKNISLSLKLLVTLLITSVISIGFQYFINRIRDKKNLNIVFTEDNIIANALIISLISYKEKYIVIIVATLISMIIKLFNKNINISSTLYGILFIILYREFFKGITPEILTNHNIYQNILELNNIKTYLLGINKNYLPPLLGIISFIYLFNRKSIKYEIVFSYMITFTIIMLSYSLIKNHNINLYIYQMLTGNILFYIVFTGTDYKITPITNEGERVYGIILAILSSITWFIAPELSLIILLILCPLILTKYIDKLSYKLKYNTKFYNLIITICIVLSLITIPIICLIY